MREILGETLKTLGLYLLQLLAFISLVLFEIRFQLAVIGLLIFFDTFLALRYISKKAKKEGKKRRELFSSNRFNNLFAKIISYGVFIGIGYVIQKSFSIEYAVWLSCAVPFYSEIRSIDENQRKLGQKGILQEVEDLYNLILNLKKKQDKLREK